jgi:bifunctional non-homologous end joining protein LigD
VEIWDSGDAEIEKWRPDEVIVTLSGAPGGGLGGRRRYALFRTRDDPQKPQWMIHLMQERKQSTGPDGERSEERGPLRPMLATRGSESELRLLDEDEWAFEMKWDGIRAIVEVDGGKVRLRNRSGGEVTAAYPELSDIDAAIAAEDAVLDGEIVAFDEGGAPSFARLQQRMNLVSAREIEDARHAAPVSLVLFDVLRINGRDCLPLPYRQRRELLEELVEEGPHVPLLVPPAFDGDGEAALRASRELRLEGVMAKRLESAYRPGARSADWLKLPHASAAEAVVIGWRISEAEPEGIASLLLALPGQVGLEYAGRVGTGFSLAERRRIRDRLLRSERKTPPVDIPASDRRDARWVTPRLVGEVTFRERTADGRLRHPVWRGWRPDKSPEDITPL